MKRKYQFFQILSLFLLITLSAAEAVEVKELIGLWRSPGGNVIEIRLEENDQVNGYFFQLTPEWAALGAREGELALKNISINNQGVTLGIQVRGDRPSDEIAYAHFRKGTITNNKLQGEVQDGDYGDDGKYLTKASYSNTLTYTKVPVIKTIEPRLLWEKVDSIKITSDFLPQLISDKLLKIDGIAIQELGRFEDDNKDTVRAFFKPNQTITPGNKSVALRNVRSELDLIFYAFTIEKQEDANADPDESEEEANKIGETATFKLVTTQPTFDDLTVNWEITDERDEVTEIDWTTIDQDFPPPKGKVETETVANKLKVKGVADGLIDISATLELKQGGETLSARADKNGVLVEVNDGPPRIHSIIPKSLCEKTDRIYLFGDNLKQLNIANSRLLGPGITLRKHPSANDENTEDEMLILQIVSVSAEARGEERIFSFKTDDGETINLPHRIITFGHPVQSQRFLSHFKMDELGGTVNPLPLNALDIFRRALPNQSLFGRYENVLKDIPDAKQLINDKLESKTGPMAAERLAYVAALKIYNNPATIPRPTISVFNEQNNAVGNYPKSRSFYRDIAAGHECAILNHIAEIESIMRDPLYEKVLKYTQNGAVLREVENYLGGLVLLGLLDMAKAEELIEKAKVMLDSGDYKTKKVKAVMDKLAPEIAVQVGMTVGMTVAFSGVGKKALGALKGALGSGFKLSRYMQKNLLKFFKDADELAKTPQAKAKMKALFDKLSPEQLRGIARLADSKVNNRYVLRLMEDLGDQSPKFLTMIDDMGEAGLKINSAGLKRLAKFRGGKINAADIRAFNTSLKRDSALTQKRWLKIKDKLPKETRGRYSERKAREYYAALKKQPNNPKKVQVIEDLDNSPQIPNRYKNQMPVVDMILKTGKKRRRIISIADGKLKYSVEKFEKLIGLKGSDNYSNMLNILKKAGKVKSERDFLYRAELMVPAPHVEALRAIIGSKLKNPAYAALRRRSGLSIERILRMIQPLPHNYMKL